MSYDPTRGMRYGSSQMGRLFGERFGCLKFLGTVVLFLVILFVILLLAGVHVSHA